MKKSILAILSVLLILVLALTLFACGKTGDTDETTPCSSIPMSAAMSSRIIPAKR